MGTAQEQARGCCMDTSMDAWMDGFHQGRFGRASPSARQAGLAEAGRRRGILTVWVHRRFPTITVSIPTLAPLRGPAAALLRRLGRQTARYCHAPFAIC